MNRRKDKLREIKDKILKEDRDRMVEDILAREKELEEIERKLGCK